MAQLKYWNGSNWANAVIGAQGPTGIQGLQGTQGIIGDDGFIAQPEPPVNTSLLWLDTDAPSTILGAALLASANTFTDNQLISVNTSGNALEIRQIGAGNALVVEDSTNPDSTPFVINASGQVGIGTTSPANPLQINAATNANLQINGDSNTAVIIQRSSDDTTASVLAFRKARGTTSSRTTITAGDFLGNIRFEGFDGTNSTLAGTINLAAEGTISTGIIPGRMTFNTVNSSGTLTERMRIDSSGNVGIGKTASTKLDVNGTINGTNVTISGASVTTTGKAIAMAIVFGG